MALAMTYQQPYQTQSLWLCLRFSSLAINNAGFRFTDPVVVAITQQQEIWQTTHTAQQRGIFTGQSITHALMLYPSLQLIERNQSKELQKLHSLSEWAYHYTSHVRVYDDHTLLLEVGHSLTLFKGIKHLQHLISHDLNRLEVDIEVGLAHTPKAAHLLSFGEQADWSCDDFEQKLLQAPLEHLAIDDKIVSKLQHCGFKHLADIVDIPVSELGQRFGQEFIAYLDKLKGTIPDPQAPTSPPEIFTTRVDFAEPIRNRTWIEQQINRLLTDLVNFVAMRNLVCRGFSWRFYADNNCLLKTINIKLASSHMDLNTFKSLTELQFANVAMQWEFSSIELISDMLLTRQRHQNDFFTLQTDPDSLSQLLEKLSNRLGDDALFKVSAQPQQLPEQACKRSSIEQTSSSDHTNRTEFKDEPMWLLESPTMLIQQGDRPTYNGILQLIHGPHRITSDWWAQLQSRDYYIARQKNGRLLWIYYERGKQNWYLHGLFA